MHKSLSFMLVSLCLTGCFPDPPDGGGGTPDAGGGGNPCTRQSASGGSTEGFPFDVATFDGMLLDTLQASCHGGGGCHGPGNVNDFTVYLDTDSTCASIQTFNEVFAKSDYVAGGAESAMVKVLNGTGPAHLQNVALANQFQAFIDAAKTAYEAGGGGGGGGGGDAAFDRTMFATSIQPLIDGNGCVGGCHVAGGNSFGNFGLNASARVGTAELDANVKAVVAKIDLTLDPASATQAKFYLKATDTHSPAPITDPTARGNIEAWIAAGLMGQ